MLKKELFARMISNAWYTVNYFHLSFGKQDMLQRAIEHIKVLEHIHIDEDRDKIIDRLPKSINADTLRELNYFDRQVPHWFLSPWFSGKNRAEIYYLSTLTGPNALYALYPDHIKINPKWKDYLLENAHVLKSFCYWNLALFLQSKNPNVPDIPNKLIRPAFRNSLTKQRSQFWDIVLREQGRVQCIYTNKELSIGNYAVEHFVPYSFVSHDLIWNLIPADKSFNSAKSDKLPPMEKYFDGFFSMQKTAMDIMRRLKPDSKFLDEYLTIFPDLTAVTDLNDGFTRARFRETLQPLITIASNNGFEYMS